MASIQLKEIELQSANPAKYTDAFQWRISVDVLEPLQEDMEVKFVWVGSSESSSYDQRLEELLIGPLQVGTNEFIASHQAPDHELIPAWDVLGVTLLIIALYYKDREFVRVGYWVQVAYINENDNLNMPKMLCIERVGRNVLLTKPVVTTSSIAWSNDAAADEKDEHLID